MGATSFVRKPDGRQWSMDQGSGVWTCTEVWQATFDAEITDPLVFLGDPLLPAIGVEHTEQPLLRLKGVGGVSAPIDRSLKALNFTLIWTTAQVELGGGNGSGFNKDRYDDADRADKSWSHNTIQEPVEKAYVSDDGGTTFSVDEVPVANTLDDLYIPGLTRNRYLPVCHYVRNELAVPATILSLPGTVNNDEFTLDGLDVGIGQALISACPVSAWKRFESTEFRTVSYEIMLREEGWDEELLNKGFWHQPGIVASDPFVAVGPIERVKLPNGETDDAGQKIWVVAEEPVTLDINGQHLQWYVENGGSEELFTPHFRRFRYLQRTSFGALGFT